MNCCHLHVRFSSPLKVVIFLLAGFLTGLSGMAQLLQWNPQMIVDANNGAITITMDASRGNQGLLNHNPDDVYVHTGVITSANPVLGAWRYVKFNQNWNAPNPELKATPLGNNKWQFTIPNLRSYYGVPAGESILKIAILFRSGNGSSAQRNADQSDMYIPVIQPGTHAVRITSPYRQPTYNPTPEPLNLTVGQQVPVVAHSSLNGAMQIRYNDNIIATGTATQLSATATISGTGTQRFTAQSTSGSSTVTDVIEFYIPEPVQEAALPAGVRDGINYNAAGTAATLVLYAPGKNAVSVIGDFSNWTKKPEYQMYRTPDRQRYWITITGLQPGQEYGYQYMIDDNLKVADYYSEKVLDPQHDSYINSTYTRYPGLKPYPTGQTTGIVSVLEPGKKNYIWATTSFSRPHKGNLIIYELLLRDFLLRNDWQTLQDTIGYLSRLGINAIELMPFTEFEGNSSWGYNPSFMFAADKYYGPEDELKRFIDICHANGIAVILDLVLNHQFGQSPMVQMYWNGAANKPASNSPWFNADARHPFNVGYDMNHESDATKYFTRRVMEHWLTKFKIDGFRWDLSKGFTQTNNPNDVNAWSAFDQSRINIWNGYYAESQAIMPGAYMILEHLGADQEEAELAKTGMLLWGNMNHAYNQNSMGYVENADITRTFSKARWTSYGAGSIPGLVAYAESHDEERLAWKNVRDGNSDGGAHNTKLPSVYSKRMQTVAAFLLTAPGPKMIWQFGELAYDSSINMCEDRTTSDACRLSPKPPAWNMPGGNYNNVPYRADLRNMYSKLIALRTRNSDYVSTWTSGEVNYSTGNNLYKWQWVRGTNLSVVTAGNFNVTTQSGTVQFPFTGTWYGYATNIDAALLSSVNPSITYNAATGQITYVVNATNQGLNLPAGGFITFTDRVASLAEGREYEFIGNGSWQTAANWRNGLIPPVILPSGSRITINPVAGGEAVLDRAQTVSPGATITVLSGKNLRIAAGGLIIK